MILYGTLCAAFYVYLCFCVYTLAQRYDRNAREWLMASVVFTPFAVWLLLLAKGNNEKKNWTRGIEITLNNLTHTMNSMERTARSQQSVLADILATQPDEPLDKR